MNTLLHPLNPRHYWRLLCWLFFAPARFSAFTRGTAAVMFEAAARALLLPPNVLVERMYVVRKYSPGVTRTQTFKSDFVDALHTAFDVPDSQIPEKIVILCQIDHPAAPEHVRLMLDPAAYAVIRYRKGITGRVQQMCSGLGAALALLPALLLVLAFPPWADRSLLTSVAVLAVFTTAWALNTLPLPPTGETTMSLVELARAMLAGTLLLLALGLVLLSAAEAGKSDVYGLPLLALCVALGIGYGVSTRLNSDLALALHRGSALAVLLGTLLGSGAWQVLLLLLPGTALALLSGWTLGRAHRRAQRVAANALWLLLLGAAYALLAAGVAAGWLGA